MITTISECTQQSENLLTSQKKVMKINPKLIYYFEQLIRRKASRSYLLPRSNEHNELNMKALIHK